MIIYNFFFLSGDLLAKQLMDYAEYEKWNPSLSAGMLKFAENVSAVQDYREAQVLIIIKY